MHVLSIISLLFSVSALVIAFIPWKKVKELRFNENTDVLTTKDIGASVKELKKQVDALSEKRLDLSAEIEKNTANIITHDTKSNTITISANLLVKGWLAAEKAKEE